jgi:hypothetical protein
MNSDESQVAPADRDEGEVAQDVNASQKKRILDSVWFGPILVFAAAISYFLFFARFPVLRDFPWVNLPLVLIGFAISARVTWIALKKTGYSLVRKISAALGLLFSAAVAALFSYYIFILSYQMPDTKDVVDVGEIAPDFTLPDQSGQPIRFTELLGSKVVLVFYRGHW